MSAQGTRRELTATNQIASTAAGCRLSVGCSLLWCCSSNRPLGLSTITNMRVSTPERRRRRIHSSEGTTTRVKSRRRGATEANVNPSPLAHHHKSPPPAATKLIEFKSRIFTLHACSYLIVLTGLAGAHSLALVSSIPAPKGVHHLDYSPEASPFPGQARQHAQGSKFDSNIINFLPDKSPMTSTNDEEETSGGLAFYGDRRNLDELNAFAERQHRQPRRRQRQQQQQQQQPQEEQRPSRSNGQGTLAVASVGAVQMGSNERANRHQAEQQPPRTSPNENENENENENNSYNYNQTPTRSNQSDSHKSSGRRARDSPLSAEQSRAPAQQEVEAASQEEGHSGESRDESANSPDEGDVTDDNDQDNENDDQTGNETQIQCDTEEFIQSNRPSRAVGLLLGASYLTIFILGLLGNVITLYVLMCKGKKRSAQDILIANLACSDIMLCVFAVPITPKYLILDGHWTLGPALCKVVSFAQSTSVYMSTYSLICIGYIRYRLIVHPLEESMSKRTALLACLGTWVVSLIVTLPYMLQVKLSPEHCPLKYCDEAWAQPRYRFIFSLFTCAFQFMIPLGSVGFFNKKIYSRLDGRLAVTAHSNDATATHNKSESTHSSGNGHHHHHDSLDHLSHQEHPNQHQHQHQHQHQKHAPKKTASGVMAIKEHRQREKERRMRKANSRLIFVVVVFAHSWLPLNLFNMIQDYFDQMQEWPYLTQTFLVVHLIACSSVCWNPILYAWMSETYRQDLRCALPKCIASKFSSCLMRPPGSSHGGGGVSTSVVTINHNTAATTNSKHLASNLKRTNLNSTIGPLPTRTKSIDQISEVCFNEEHDEAIKLNTSEIHDYINHHHHHHQGYHDIEAAPHEVHSRTTTNHNSYRPAVGPRLSDSNNNTQMREPRHHQPPQRRSSSCSVLASVAAASAAATAASSDTAGQIVF